MKRIRWPSTPTIALELGSRRIRAAQFLSDPDGGRDGVWLDVARSEPDAEYGVAELASVVSTMGIRGFRGRRVVLSPPSAMLAFDWLPTPPADSGAPLAEITAGEIMRLRGFAAGSFEHRVCPTVDCGASHRALTIACPHGPMNMLLDNAAEAGFEVRGVCPSMLVLPQGEGVPESCVALDLGWSCARFIVIREGAVVFVRTLPALGMRQVASDLSERRGISLSAAEWAVTTGRSDPMVSRRLVDVLKPFGEMLAEEVAASVSYASQMLRTDFSEVLLTGGGVTDSEVDDLILAATGLNPLRLAGHAGARPGLSAVIAMARAFGNGDGVPAIESGVAA